MTTAPFGFGAMPGGAYSGLRRSVIDPITGLPVVTSAPTGEIVQRLSVLPVGRDDAGRLVPALPGLVTGAVEAAQFPGQVYRGEASVYDPATGHVSEEAVGKAFDLAGTALTGSLPFSKPAGAIGMFGGRNAKTADLPALKLAETLESKFGASREQIWEDTGWFRGADQKWRFEIPDDLATLGSAGPHAPAGYSRLHHDDLAEAYPGLWGETQQSIREGSIAKGRYDAQDGVIHAQGPSEAAQRSVALHEYQHPIQRSEGFAVGDNPQNHGAAAWEAAGRPMLSEAPDAASAHAAWARDQYHRSAGEVEARNVQRRADMSPGERFSTPPWLTQDVPDAEQIVRFGLGGAATLGAASALASPGIAQAAPSQGTSPVSASPFGFGAPQMRPEDLARLFQAMPMGAPQGFAPIAESEADVQRLEQSMGMVPASAPPRSVARPPLSFGAPAGSMTVPLPPQRPSEFQTSQADLPAEGAQAIMSAAQTAPPAAEGPSFLDRIMGGIRSTDGLLTSLGIGLMSNAGFGQGLAAGLQSHQQGEGRRAAAKLAQAEYGLKANKLAREQNAENQTAKFIQSKIPGMTTEQATALAGNTSFVNEILKGVVPPQEVYKQHTDANGNVWNENTRTGQQTVALQAKDNATKDEGAKITAQMEARRAQAPALGLVEGSPEWRSFVGTGKIGREQDITAADRKVINAAEDELPVIDSTLDTLKRARDLNRKTFTGTGANARAQIGTRLPDWLVPDGLADPQGAKDTREFGQLMSMEAIKSMSSTLKGATTDREMDRFMEILGDPTTPPDTRETTIDRMIKLAERQKELAQSRITEMRDGTYYKRGGGSGQAPAAPQQTQTPARDPLSSARDAIAKGASREAVISRLRASGIDPAGL